MDFVWKHTDELDPAGCNSVVSGCTPLPRGVAPTDTPPDRSVPIRVPIPAGLTDKQHLAIKYLVARTTDGEVAELVGRSRQTGMSAGSDAGRAQGFADLRR